jgi:hypothetical protein
MHFATARSLLLVHGLALGGLALGLIGCDQAEHVDAVSFEDGVMRDTEGGAFRVSLHSRTGLEVGASELVAHVGFHDPADPDGPGFGVPGARVHLDAFPVDGEGGTVELEATYVGEGHYAFDGLEFSDPGAWEFEFNIEVGETLDESVSFAFEIDG